MKPFSVSYLRKMSLVKPKGKRIGRGTKEVFPRPKIMGGRGGVRVKTIEKHF